MRIQGSFVSDAEIEKVTSFIKSQYEAEYDEAVIEHIEKEHEQLTADLESEQQDAGMTRSGSSTRDELFLQAVEMVMESGQASVAMFQRKLRSATSVRHGRLTRWKRHASSARMRGQSPAKCC